MQRVPKQLVGNVQLSASVATYYTVPANTWTTIAAVSLNNTSATARTSSIHLVPSGGSATNSNQHVSALAVPATGAAPTTVPALVGQIMGPGATIQMVAEAAAAITPLISGYESVVS